MNANRCLFAVALMGFTACSDANPAGIDGGIGMGGSGDLAGAAPDLAGPDLATPPAVRFIVIGDAGKGNAAQMQVAGAMEATCAKSGCDFVQMLGDNIYDSGTASTTDPLWQSHFEVPYANLDLPFWAVLGNHDYGGGGTGSEFGKGSNQVAYSMVSQKWRMPAPYYRRAVQNVEFFALDTNMQMYGMDGQQQSEVANWIGASSATWKIAMGHHPYLSNGPHGNAGNYDGLPSFTPIAAGTGVKDFMDDTICGKVDLYLAGHDHSRQWLEDTCKGTELIISGAGASVTELKGSNPVHFQNLELGFVYIVISGKTLTAEFIDVTGKSEFTRTLTKP
jgi:tartrate-resistant acid phosphatase type 5